MLNYLLFRFATMYLSNDQQFGFIDVFLFSFILFYSILFNVDAILHLNYL